ncbi:NrfD/PsrC family molybdoenzyme membrane anchor subunit [Pseudodesulfovibrio senegalensis]|jgi:Ni/Fe-hydrogenase subunit HybB-like protein|uniref:Ni/Fe-hydrogenase cytochrome b subunit n=1 Tax=Pseudodesulfovibrio senegalensis TaxID=1721087 RepID=A0A6N6N1B4_9BACT|nr:Ni/Fe-hydrogenase cytochrome b subunit [Pseudodesulfovibrio senegalensis]KAB1441513.1 Ni/Fe-hydrogenase cytochrome b subunit [Pseudodesulfovibrio senegalensis]
MTHKPYPVDRPFWTPGTYVMLVFMIAAALTLVVRYTFGLAAVTNLNNHYPWGIWIGLDVASGVALAAGGFTTAFLAHILGRHYYEAVTRPALLTAALGYTFVAIAVFVDIGRSWAIWKPIVYQNHNSALFEVAMCVMTYVTVLWIEFIPVLAERLGKKIRLLAFLNRILDKTMWVFIILGVVLSCMHQSSLGTLLVIAPTKVSPLWHTPLMPLLFLTSAFAVGYPMVVVETTIATSSLKLDSEMNVLGPLSRITILLLGIYMAIKVGDLIARGAYVTLLDGSAQSNSFLVEVVLGVIVPWVMLLFPAVRRSRKLLFSAAFMIVAGVMLNRFNVFVVSFKAPYASHPYYPAIGEVLVTAGAVATIFFLYRVFVTFFPVLSAQKQEVSQ